MEFSASTRVLKALLPTTVVVVVVGRCSTIWQRLLVESCTI
jgi:hypothetical protein